MKQHNNTEVTAWNNYKKSLYYNLFMFHYKVRKA